MSLRSSDKSREGGNVPSLTGNSVATEPEPSRAASIQQSADMGASKANSRNGSEDPMDWAGRYANIGSFETDLQNLLLGDPNQQVPEQHGYWHKEIESKEDFDKNMESYLREPDGVRDTLNFGRSGPDSVTATNAVGSVDAGQGGIEDDYAGSSDVVLPSIEVDDGPERHSLGLNRGRRSRGSSGRGRLRNEESSAGSSRRGRGRITKVKR
jgi:hypothetical protein